MIDKCLQSNNIVISGGVGMVRDRENKEYENRFCFYNFIIQLEIKNIYV